MAGAKKAYLEQEMTKDELACIYSALILADDDIPVTEEKMMTLMKAANIEVEPLWPSLFARALSGCNLKSMIQNIAGSATLGGGAATGGGAAPEGEAAEAEKKEEKKAEPEPEEDSDEDFGFGLFD